jgi:hypothetical protein
MTPITLQLIAWAFIVGFFAGFGWSLAAWIVGRLTAKL